MDLDLNDIILTVTTETLNVLKRTLEHLSSLEKNKSFEPSKLNKFRTFRKHRQGKGVDSTKTERSRVRVPCSARADTCLGWDAWRHPVIRATRRPAERLKQNKKHCLKKITSN